MNRASWISLLGTWGSTMLNHPQRSSIVEKAVGQNPWFIPEDVDFALQTIGNDLLDPAALEHWLDGYPGIDGEGSPMTIGLVLAGNIPLVGFHDVLCTLVAGHHSQMKLSSKDAVLLPWALNVLLDLEPSLSGRWHFVERLANFDAVIATGSGNSARYFHYYFRQYPHLIRGNRSSVAVLDGSESLDELELLGQDVFRYFGLGCRSISHVLIPESFDPARLLDAFEGFRPRIEHSRFHHNMDYQRTLQLMNRVPHIGNEFLTLVESNALVSPISVLHFQYYKDAASLQALLDQFADKVQVVSGKSSGMVPFGMTQRPGPAEYADQVDTLQFLLEARTLASNAQPS